MFTGIIECLGTVKDIKKEGTNVHLNIASPISNELKIDQSVAHNGVCLTVVEQTNDQHIVTAIKETMERSNLSGLKTGDVINLERAMLGTSRFDGHFVQGHVDSTAKCLDVKDESGSWLFTFSYEDSEAAMYVDKGSICINGVSLTVIKPENNKFSVAIIPYTYEHTSFKQIKVGTVVNIEFDIIGKYINKNASLYLAQLK